MPSSPNFEPAAPLDLTGLAMGAVHLRTRDATRLVPFYQQVVGLTELSRSADRVTLGAGGRPLVVLEQHPGLGPVPQRAPGLFHLAVRVPDRASLAARLHALRASGARFGASDHRVSEALYVDDPDGNGVEIYRDRPAEDWPWEGTSIAMATEPLDLADLAAQAPPSAAVEPAPAGTDMGHVHLKVTDLAATRAFWGDVVGLTLMAEYPGALFMAADGYHHHLGLNVWQSRGTAPAPAGTSGLDRLTLHLPPEGIAALHRRLAQAGWPVALDDGTLCFADPSGNGVQVASP